MRRVNVKSSNLNSLGYDEINHVLEVEFNTGSIYQYFDVPKEVFANLINARSLGKYFNRNIAHNFDYTLINSGNRYRYTKTKVNHENNSEDTHLFRALVRIFHPDNKYGNEKMMVVINTLRDEKNYYEIRKIANKYGIN